MTATMTTVNGICKEVYEGRINDQLQSATITSKRFERSSEGIVEDTVGGKYVTFPVRHTRNHGTSYRAENTQMAAAGRQGYAAATETLKYGYQRVYITGPVMELAEKNYQSFASALDRELDGAKDDIGKDVNRITYGHPATSTATGILCLLTATTTGTSLTVADTQYIEIGMVIDISNAGTPVTGGTARTVTAKTATTITVDSAVAGATTGNAVTRTGNYNQEPYGLSRIIDSTGSLHGLDPASTANYWSSTEDGSTTTLAELGMIKVCDDIFTASGKRPTAVFCSLGVRRAYWNLLTSLRRYNEPKQWTGGLVGLAFNHGTEIPVVEDPDCPLKHMFFVNESQFKVYRAKPWYWDDTSGNVFKWVTGFDAHEAVLKCYWQQGTHQRNAHGKYTNITES